MLDLVVYLAPYVGGTALALIAFLFILKKFIVGWKLDNAEASVLTLMHTELERMSAQNTQLSVELGNLQSDILKLNRQLRDLSFENQQLHSEVSALTTEISRLQHTLQIVGN